MNFDFEANTVKKGIIENAQYMNLFENCASQPQNEIKKLNNEIINMRLELGENIIRLKDKQMRLDRILADAAAESRTLQEFELKYANLNRAEQKKRFNVKQTLEYREFMAEMSYNNKQVLKADAEDDLITSDSPCSMYDPWTKGLMLNPVINTVCGHHYDWNSVNSVICNNMSVCCPVVGCASKTYIKPNNLKQDIRLLDKIKAYSDQLEAENVLSSEDDD